MVNILIIETKQFTSEIMGDCISRLNYSPYIYNFELCFSDNLDLCNPNRIIFNLNLFKKSKSSLSEIRGRTNPITLILTSNYLIDPEGIKILGADFFLSKPYGLETFSTVLQQAVDFRKAASTEAVWETPNLNSK